MGGGAGSIFALRSWAAGDGEVADGRVPSLAAKASAVVCLGDVDLEHGITALSVLQPGRVSEVLAQENSNVPAGAVLLRLDDCLPRLQVAEARVALENSRSRLLRGRKAPAQQQARLEQQQQAVAAAGQRLAGARSLLARKHKLAAAQSQKDRAREIGTPRCRQATCRGAVSPHRASQ